MFTNRNYKVRLHIYVKTEVLNNWSYLLNQAIETVYRQVSPSSVFVGYTDGQSIVIRLRCITVRVCRRLTDTIPYQ